MDFEIDCYLNLHQDLYHASRVYTGLCDLRHRGIAKLRFLSTRTTDRIAGDSSYSVCVRVKFCESGETRLIVIDLLDRSDAFEAVPLANCDVYLKRSYYEPDKRNLPSELRTKVIPFGLNYACRSVATIQRIIGTLAPRLLCRFKRKDARRQIDMVWKFLSSPDARAFERNPEVGAEPTILFQTRVWSPTDIRGNPDEINGERVAVIRALRKAFGNRFRGGLVPSDYAMQYYPEEISKLSAKHSQYAKWGKKSLIAINTRGLHNSLAFKLPEYLAASKCVVSCPLRNELPAPLLEGQHYLSFRTPDECVDHCENLISNSKLAARLRQEAWDYYRREVEPSAHIRNCLVRAGQLAPHSC